MPKPALSNAELAAELKRLCEVVNQAYDRYALTERELDYGTVDLAHTRLSLWTLDHAQALVLALEGTKDA